MKIALIIIAVVAVLGLVIGGCSHKFSSPEKRAEYITKKISKKLDLNNDQKIYLDVLKNEVLSVRQTMKDKRETGFTEFRELLKDERINRERANGLMDNHFQTFQSHSPALIAAAADFWDSLNPEQQEKARAKMEKFHSSCGRWCDGNRHHK